MSKDAYSSIIGFVKLEDVTKHEFKLGDIFRIGNHFLVYGSCLESELIGKVMDISGEKISLICSDPPYGVDYVGSKQSLTGKNIGSKDIIGDGLMSDEAYQSFIESTLSVVKPYLVKKNSFYLFNSDKMVVPLINGIRGSGFKFAQLLIWVKSNPVVGRLDYLPMHELVAYGWFGAHSFLKSKDKSVLYEPKPASSKMHPTTKPLPLIRRLILNSSRIGEIVWDGFLGSGTTLLACEQTGRRCVGFELEPEYCKIIIQRLQKLNPRVEIEVLTASEPGSVSRPRTTSLLEFKAEPTTEG